MNTHQVPSVELIQGPGVPMTGTMPPRWQRWKIFLGVLLLASLIGLAIVYAREPLYRASASVLTVKPKAVDSRSEEADTEHVVIQGQLLLGEELLGRLGATLRAAGDSDSADVNQLRSMLSAVPVPETNLLELVAEGGNPEQLQRMVNTWAETYESFRAEEIEAATGRTTNELEDEQAQLGLKIADARAALASFREENDIVSLERGENPNLARLSGLNDSLNKARERQVDAQAKFTAIQDAIAKGETVVPREHKAELAKKQLEVERKRDQIEDLTSKYTQRYIDRDPALKALPGELREMERDLARATRIGQRTMIDEAQQDWDAAKASVVALEQQLVDHQGKVQVFTESFKEFKSLEADLQRLEELDGEIDSRLARIQVRNLKKYPPIQVVDWASVPDRPVYPNYERDLMIALGVALLLALFVTWLFEYLTGRPNAGNAGPYVGMRVYPPEGGAQLEGRSNPVLAHNAAPPSLAQAPHNPAIPPGMAEAPAAAPQAPPADLPVMPRELALQEVRALLDAADTLTGGYCTLLLSGVAPVEMPLMHAPCIDRDAGVISVPGAYPRDLEVADAAWPRLQGFVEALTGGSMNLPSDELNANLAMAAADAGLSNPITVNAAAVAHTYLLYLVRQGVRLSELPYRVGAMAPDLQRALAYFSPPGENRPLMAVDVVYPALKS